jgi:hypothetical protein
MRPIADITRGILEILEKEAALAPGPKGGNQKFA